MRAATLVVVAATFCANVAWAEGVATSLEISDIRVDNDGKAMVRFSGNLVGSRPGCVNPAYSNYLAFDASTAGGKNTLALVLSAKLGGRPVSAFGTGTCPTYGLIENWWFGSLE